MSHLVIYIIQLFVYNDTERSLPLRVTLFAHSQGCHSKRAGLGLSERKVAELQESSVWLHLAIKNFCSAWACIWDAQPSCPTARPILPSSHLQMCNQLDSGSAVMRVNQTQTTKQMHRPVDFVKISQNYALFFQWNSRSMRLLGLRSVEVLWQMSIYWVSFTSIGEVRKAKDQNILWTTKG